MKPLSRRKLLRRSLELPCSIIQTSPASAPELSVDDALEGLRKLFVTWLDSECALTARWFGGISRLHLDFCEWCIAHNEVPSNRAEFEGLLTDLGFLIGDVHEIRLVSGLVLKTDLEVQQAFANDSE
jgi:hypothetical protein